MENSPYSVLRAKYANTFVAAMPSFKVKMFGKRKAHTLMWYTLSRNNYCQANLPQVPVTQLSTEGETKYARNRVGRIVEQPHLQSLG